MVVSAPGTMGTIAMSAFTAMAPTAMTGLTNMASSTGYPWTTGMLTIAAPGAVGGEIFMVTGMDSRVGGVGAIQLVSATLSRRTITGPNANRAWLRLNIPEPSATLGTLGALGMLALCHALARRRSR
jgi:MYXO-CTERM domain-containing protein